MSIPNYCVPCGENLLPEQTECPFCGQMATPVDELAVQTKAPGKAFGGVDCPVCGADCPVCGRTGPHNHSALVVEAFHRANENEARNFGLVTFSIDEIRDLIRRRAKGLNDRAERRI